MRLVRVRCGRALWVWGLEGVHSLRDITYEVPRAVWWSSSGRKSARAGTDTVPPPTPNRPTMIPTQPPRAPSLAASAALRPTPSEAPRAAAWRLRCKAASISGLKTMSGEIAHMNTPSASLSRGLSLIHI